MGLYDIPCKLEESSSAPGGLKDKVDCSNLKAADEGSFVDQLETIFLDSFYEMAEGYKNVFIMIPSFEKGKFRSNAEKYAFQIELVLGSLSRSGSGVPDIGINISYLRNVLESMNLAEKTRFLAAEGGSTLVVSPVETDEENQGSSSEGPANVSDVPNSSVQIPSQEGTKEGTALDQGTKFETMIPSTSTNTSKVRMKNKWKDKKSFNTNGGKKLCNKPTGGNGQNVVVMSGNKFKLLAHAKLADGQHTLLTSVQADNLLQTVFGKITKLNLCCMDQETVLVILVNYASFQLIDVTTNETDVLTEYTFEGFLDHLLATDVVKRCFVCKQCHGETFASEWEAMFHVESDHKIKVNCIVKDENDRCCGKSFSFGRSFIQHFLNCHFRHELFKGYYHTTTGHGKKKGKNKNK